MASIQFHNISKIFGKPVNVKKAVDMLLHNATNEEIALKTDCHVALRNISFTIPQKEITTILGLSGSGKSTLLRLINGLLKPTLGDIFIIPETGNKITVNRLFDSELKRLRTHLVSMVFQNPNLLPWRTVKENVALGLEFLHFNKAEINQLTDVVLEMVELKAFKNKPVQELSGGMQQRVGIARALVLKTPILLMDEPFSALDPIIKSRMHEELLDLFKQLSNTIVLITHDIDEALKLGNQLVIMEKGQVIVKGSAIDVIKNSSDNPIIKGYISRVNVFKLLKLKSCLKAPAQQIVFENNNYKSYYHLNGRTLEIGVSNQILDYLLIDGVSFDLKNSLTINNVDFINSNNFFYVLLIDESVDLNQLLFFLISQKMIIVICQDGCGTFQGIIDIPKIVDLLSYIHKASLR